MSFFRSAAACRAPPLLDAHWSAEKLASHKILEDDQSSFTGQGNKKFLRSLQLTR